MMRQVIDEEVDLAVPGFYVTPEREKHADMSIGIFNVETHLFVHRLSKNKISLINYLYEYSLVNWLLILATSACLILAIYVFTSVLRLDDKRLPYTAVMKGLLYQGTSYNARRLSMRVLLLVNLLFCSVVVLSYRSCMNSFLAITLPVLELRNLEEAEAKGRRLTYWGGGATEGLLASSVEGTPTQKLYLASLEDDEARTGSYKEGIDALLRDEDRVLVAEGQLIKDYPCSLAQVPRYVFYTWQVALVFPKGSPLAGPFNREILRMKQLGVIDRLLSAYNVNGRGADKKAAECHFSGSATSLSFDHVFAPFGMLVLGALASLASVLVERFLLRKRGAEKAMDLESLPISMSRPGRVHALA